MRKAAVAARPGVTLRGPDKPKPEAKKVLFNFRADPELIQYLEDASRRMATDKTKVLVAAVELDRDLDRRLGDLRDELSDYAKARGLELKDDLAEVLADLVRVGLNSMRKARR